MREQFRRAALRLSTLVPALVVAALVVGACDRAHESSAPPATAPTGSPVIRVTDAAGAPVFNCFVTVTDPDSGAQADWGKTSKDGTATLSGLDPRRRYTLAVEPPPERRAGLQGRRTEGWPPSDTDIRLAALDAIEGDVRDEQGRAVPGACVFVRGSGQQAVVDANGHFVLEAVPAGTSVEIGAMRSGTVLKRMARDRLFDPKDALQTVRAGDRHVVLVIPPVPEVVVRLDEPAPELGALSYAIAKGDEVAYKGSTDSTPSHGLRVSDVDPSARYTVWVGPTPDGRFGVLEDVAPDGTERVIRLVKGLSLRVKVVAPPDVPLESVVVTVAHGALTATASRGDDGVFRAEGLPPGPCRVQAVRLAPDASSSGEAAAEAGGEVTVTMRHE